MTLTCLLLQVKSRCLHGELTPCHKYGVFTLERLVSNRASLYILEDLRTGKLTLTCDHGLSCKELVVMSKYYLRPVGKLASLSSLQWLWQLVRALRHWGLGLFVERPQVRESWPPVWALSKAPLYGQPILSGKNTVDCRLTVTESRTHFALMTLRFVILGTENSFSQLLYKWMPSNILRFLQKKKC